MRRTPHSRAIIFPTAIAAVLVALLSNSCAGGGRERAPRAPDPSRVEAHSVGLIPAGSAVKVVLTRAAGEAGTVAPKGVFRFFPAVSGEASWDDERTLSFAPDKPLAQGKRYRVEVDMGAIGAGAGAVGASRGTDYFSFDIVAAKQRVAVETLPPRVARDGSVLVEGTVRLTNGLSDAAVERGLSASAGILAWNHESDKLHRFTVSGIAAGTKVRAVALRWNLADSIGSAAGRVRGQAVVKLPSASSFELIGTRKLDDASGSKGVELAFSRPLEQGPGPPGPRLGRWSPGPPLFGHGLDPVALLRGLARLGRAPCREGAQGRLGRLRSRSRPSATVAFDWEKPLVRFITKGNILPTEPGPRAADRDDEPLRRRRRGPAGLRRQHAPVPPGQRPRLLARAQARGGGRMAQALRPRLEGRLEEPLGQAGARPRSAPRGAEGRACSRFA